MKRFQSQQAGKSPTTARQGAWCVARALENGDSHMRCQTSPAPTKKVNNNVLTKKGRGGEQEPIYMYTGDIYIRYIQTTQTNSFEKGKGM